MTLRSLEEHNAARHADYDVEQAHMVLGKPIGVACPGGQLHRRASLPAAVCRV